MLNLFRMQQRPAALEQLDDRLVCFENLQAVVLRQSIVNYAGRVNVASGIKLVADARCKVLGPMRWSRVHHSCSGVHGDVICDDP